MKIFFKFWPTFFLGLACQVAQTLVILVSFSGYSCCGGFWDFVVLDLHSFFRFMGELQCSNS